jgi:hypothetical protein
MTGYLVPVSKAKKKKGTGPQAANAAKVPREHLVNVPHVNQTRLPPGPLSEALPKPPPPDNPLSPVRSGRGKWVAGGALLATGAGGAYLYRRRRVEKSLSSMQRDWPSVMMSTT